MGSGGLIKSEIRGPKSTQSMGSLRPGWSQYCEFCLIFNAASPLNWVPAWSGTEERWQPMFVSAIQFLTAGDFEIDPKGLKDL
jgi:hypothetical protein